MKRLVYLLVLISTASFAQTKEYKEGIYRTYQDYLDNNIEELQLNAVGINGTQYEKLKYNSDWVFKNKNKKKVFIGCMDFFVYLDKEGNLFTTRKLIWGKKNRTYLIQLSFWVAGEKHSLLSEYHGINTSVPGNLYKTHYIVSGRFFFYLENPTDEFVKSFTHKELAFFGNKTPESMHELSGYSYEEMEEKVVKNKQIIISDTKNDKAYTTRNPWLATYIQSIIDANIRDNSNYKILRVKSDEKDKD